MKRLGLGILILVLLQSAAFAVGEKLPGGGGGGGRDIGNGRMPMDSTSERRLKENQEKVFSAEKIMGIQDRRDSERAR